MSPKKTWDTALNRHKQQQKTTYDRKNCTYYEIIGKIFINNPVSGCRERAITTLSLNVC